MVLKQIAARIDRFLAHYLDSEVVVFFQVVVYLHMAVAAAYGLFVARGIPAGLAASVPDDAPAVAAAWLVLLSLGTLTLIGRALVASRWAQTRAAVYTFGAWLQLTGDLSMTWGFFWYVMATWNGDFFWGKECIAAFGFLALTWCAFFLVIRDVRRIMQAERAVRE